MSRDCLSETTTLEVKRALNILRNEQEHTAAREIKRAVRRLHEAIGQLSPSAVRELGLPQKGGYGVSGGSSLVGALSRWLRGEISTVTGT